MPQFFRVFGRNDIQPPPTALLEEVRRLCPDAQTHFRGDDLGWFAAELVVDPDEPPLRLDRYLTKEDDIRADLNTWAAWLESAGESPIHLRLMQHVISTTQLFTLHQPVEDHEDNSEADSKIDNLCAHLCRFLASSTDGVYQADHQGFFSADGVRLVSEEEAPLA
jgi:hypothetical protein